MIGYVDAFEEAGLLREFVAVLDRINSTLAVAERYRPPSIIVRTLIYDGLKMLDGFVRNTADTLARQWTMSARSYETYSMKPLEVSEDDADEEWAAAKWIGFGPGRGDPDCKWWQEEKKITVQRA